MPGIDQDDDRTLRDAFERYRAGELPNMVAPGADVARRTLSHRRHRRTVTLAVVVLMALIAGGSAIFAAAQPDHRRHVTPATHPPSPGRSGSVAPTPSRKHSAGSARKQVPDGRIGAAELDNATLDLPAWPWSECPSGPGAFHNGERTGETVAALPGHGSVPMPGLLYTDVDGDGADETVAMFWCEIQGDAFQVVAFDRDAAGHIVTLGAVAQTESGPETVDKLDGLRAGGDGSVLVRWTQTHQMDPVSQWRTYRLGAQGFSQTAGPTSLPVRPTVTTRTQASMAATTDGYAGTMTISLTNSASSANQVTPLSVQVTLPGQVTAASASGGKCNLSDAHGADCDPGSLQPGATWTVTLQLTSTAAHQDTDRDLSAAVELSSRSDSEYSADWNIHVGITLPAAP